MLLYLFLLCQILPSGQTACSRHFSQIRNSVERSDNVFLEEAGAHNVLRRHLLFNRFDLEAFTPGNLERECFEEICNYEEAREVFENYPDTDVFWKGYIEGHKESHPSRIDVTALLVGIVVTGVSIFLIGLLIWYLCQLQYKNAFPRSPRVSLQRNNGSLMVTRLEEISLQPVGPHSEEMHPPGLPSYEQALATCGPHDAAPPPYPGSRPGSLSE
ncbi:transmembrane gamma-carboxyglutamic acid protein 4 isoform X2 [Paramormyrops kingsleyae]|uniref:Proline rich Gla (G-carboxyglutamic acid) 4 (transmembrane) n=1 Tax=Paramormyrops kingsleyae TaxID=1676925 RepID=A0A3B3QQW1_9TELE|nr:transmembrane gamma-carboxyglutamic acid protein 4 isoform X2 [Paramormyrops kingsleyae]